MEAYLDTAACICPVSRRLTKARPIRFGIEACHTVHPQCELQVVPVVVVLLLLAIADACIRKCLARRAFLKAGHRCLFRRYSPRTVHLRLSFLFMSMFWLYRLIYSMNSATYIRAPTDGSP